MLLFYINRLIPISIKIIPEIMLQRLFGKFLILIIFFPIKLPRNKNIIRKLEINIGKIKEHIPAIPLPKETEIESIDKAMPKNKASFRSIVFELSISKL